GGVVGRNVAHEVSGRSALFDVIVVPEYIGDRARYTVIPTVVVDDILEESNALAKSDDVDTGGHVIAAHIGAAGRIRISDDVAADGNIGRIARRLDHDILTVEGDFVVLEQERGNGRTEEHTGRKCGGIGRGERSICGVTSVGIELQSDDGEPVAFR